ncbi:metallophosphoesterase family protein [uncultured Amphritea sp.]|uniref:metallophosphoesterase family protein n=1 Tax=uncultured Amphritea sp. TaxID=981605 RepID=UPI0026099C92|nr:metallophosphoesterase family protein [uncultured Amphritea sp.]
MTSFTPDHSSPLLIFGGPYSNLQATHAIRQVADSLGIQPGNVLCTGDLVAYCAEPDETVELIRDWGIAVVAGNCEESVGNGSADCGCGFSEGSSCDLLSAQWYNFTLPRVSETNKAWMRQLPEQIRFNYGHYRFTALHGGFHSNNQFIFASGTANEKSRQLALTESDIILAGHCGIPFGQEIDNGYWLNAGVIGMPANDGTPDTWYMLITLIEQQLVCSWHRLTYDHSATAAQMISSGLNNGYMKALSTGLWPSLDVLPESEKALTGQPITLSTMTIGSADSS